MRPLEERFWSKVKKTTTCWNWVGSAACGYGQFNIDGKIHKAHRISWELINGPIPNKGKDYHGTCVLHRCDNRACVNPKHLFLGTNADNMKDKVKKNRQTKGEKSNSCKLTESQVLDIRSRPHCKGYQTQLAKEFNVHNSDISRIINKKHWKHI